MKEAYHRLMVDEDKVDRTNHEMREHKLLDTHNDMQRMLGQLKIKFDTNAKHEKKISLLDDVHDGQQSKMETKLNDRQDRLSDLITEKEQKE